MSSQAFGKNRKDIGTSSEWLIFNLECFDKIKLNLSDQEKEKSDPLYEDALQTVLTGNNASTTYLQRKLKIGYARAASLMDELENYGIISPPEGSKPRQILLSTQERAEFLEK